MPTGAYLLIGLVAGALLGYLIALALRKPDLAQPLADLERRFTEAFSKTTADLAERIEKVKGDLRLDLADRLQSGLLNVRETVEQQLASSREEQAKRLLETSATLALKLQEMRTTTETGLSTFAEKQESGLSRSRNELTSALGTLAERNEKKLEDVKAAVEKKLTQIQADNSLQLEQMRKTVDEKLQGTLERRLGESFKLVSERLEVVHQGLGEMQKLANGVGDLKKVLTNVKARGIWGEMQLGNLLEQVLTPDQYACNVVTRPGTNERVEFAIRLPGRDDQNSTPVWLPIDAKFPKEDYERLVDAAEQADSTGLELAAAQLEARVKLEARTIRNKYVEPPHTTDFAILYLPVEGLYAEVLRRPGLLDTLQRDFRITIAGPTVLTALLNSLQMGFRTLAIEQRSSEVWQVLASVKNEFGKFGDVIGKVQKKLQEASNVIDSAATRTRAIERQLKAVGESGGPVLANRSSTPDLLPLEDEEPQGK
jgi:DNA recombination protein RmuC